MSKFIDFCYGFFLKTKTHFDCGVKWIGNDGLINMESAALLTIFFMIFFPIVISCACSFILVMTKCIIDKKNGHDNEIHDFICAVIGVLIGAMLGVSHVVFTSLL